MCCWLLCSECFVCCVLIGPGSSSKKKIVVVAVIILIQQCLFRKHVLNRFLERRKSLPILNLTNMGEWCRGQHLCRLPMQTNGKWATNVQKSPPDFPDRCFSKNNSAATANFEVGGIPFSGEPSNASGLLETHSHPLRQTLINLCAQVWISRLNLWHAALPERHHLRLLRPPPPPLFPQTKTRLAALPLSSLLLLLVRGSGGHPKPLKGPFS